MPEPVENTRLFLRHPHIARFLAGLRELSRSKFTWLFLLPLVILYFGGQAWLASLHRQHQARLDQADRDLNMLSDRLKDYNNKEGHYPLYLEALVEEGRLETLPVDPFSRKKEPYRYLNLNDEKHVVVYSVGPDGRDDFSGNDIYKTLQSKIPEDEKLYLYENLQIEMTRDDPDNGMSRFMEALIARDFVLDSTAFNKADMIFKYGWEDTFKYLRILNESPNYRNRNPSTLSTQYLMMMMMRGGASFSGKGMPAGYPQAATPVEGVPLDFQESLRSHVDAEEGDVLDLFAKNETAFDFLLEGAHTPYSKTGIKQDFLTPYTPPPNFLSVQVFAKVALAKGKYLEYLGRPQEALDLYLACIRLGQATGQHPLLIARLIDIAVEGMSHKRIQDCVISADFPPPVLLDLIRRIETIEKLAPTMEEAFRGEQKLFVDGVRNMSVFHKETLCGFDGPVPDDPEFINYLVTAWVMVRRGKIIRNNAEIWDRIITENRKPYPDREEINPDELIKDMDILNRISFPNYSNSHIRDLVCQTQSAGTKLLLGLQHYHAVHGEYPETLGAIADLYETPPIDPFSTKPFVYIRKDDGFSLYSLGPQIDDNLGALEYDPTNGTVSAGDIVFGRIKDGK